MSTTQHTINLLSTKTSGVSEILTLESNVQKVSLVFLTVFLGVSVICASIYGLLFMRLNKQEEEKKQLITRINAQKSKEAYILAIKERTQTVEKVMSNQKPWAVMLDLVNSLAAPPSLTNISVDEDDKVLATIRTKSMDELLTIVDTIKAKTEERKIKNPQIVTFQIIKDGYYEIGLSFVSIF